MNQIMPKDEGCIRYLMKEMDPSEEIEFEREMMGDEDLLIEVESLRKIIKKVDNIPEWNPPSLLSKTITKKAVHIRRNQIQKNNYLFFNLNKNVAAAAAVLIFTVAGLSFYAYEAAQSGYNLQNNAVTTKTVNAVQPWVDKNNILRYSDVQNNSSGELLYIEMAKSMDKLTPVESEASSVSRPQDIMLTGSPN